MRISSPCWKRPRRLCRTLWDDGTCYRQSFFLTPPIQAIGLVLNMLAAYLCGHGCPIGAPAQIRYCHEWIHAAGVFPRFEAARCPKSCRNPLLVLMRTSAFEDEVSHELEFTTIIAVRLKLPRAWHLYKFNNEDFAEMHAFRYESSDFNVNNGHSRAQKALSSLNLESGPAGCAYARVHGQINMPTILQLFFCTRTSVVQPWSFWSVLRLDAYT